ncbi:MAG: esterase/lipase family protein, partial [Anaerolineae bacterium]
LNRRIFTQFMGEREAAELNTLLMQTVNNKDRPLTVLLPGLMGSLLSSVRGISGMLWISPSVLLNGQINLLELDESGTQDRSPDVRIQPVGLEKLYYLNLILTLANETHLFEFPYDWRLACQINANELHQALLRWSVSFPDQQFTLIGHSMGGLVIRTYLALHPVEARRLIRKVILLASPLYGSPLAAAFLTNSAPNRDISARLHPANNMVSLAGTCPAMYQLLPPPPGMFTKSRYYPADWDLYNAEAWRTGNVRQQHLDNANALYQLLDASELTVPIYQIAGTGIKTMTDIRQERSGTETSYSTVYYDSLTMGGDNQVPLYSAWNPHYTTYFINENHTGIPGNIQVRQAVLDLVYDRTPGLPQVPTAVQMPSTALNAAAIVRPFQELRQRFEQGTFNRDDLARLFFGSSS